MPSIPPDLLHRLRHVLLRCRPFDDEKMLRAMFVDARIFPWRDIIPSVNNPSDRVNSLIDALCDKFSEEGENALVLFLWTLTDAYDLDGTLRYDLVDLARNLEQIFSDTSTAIAPPKSARVDYYLHIPLPEYYVPRPELLAIIRTALTPVDSKGANSIALLGMGGIGKTVLARALCDDPKIQATFPDGILWTTLGANADEADLKVKLCEWIEVLGGMIQEELQSLSQLRTTLENILSNRASLLIVDDVWNYAQAAIFRLKGKHCRLLITTRNTQIANRMGATVVNIDGLSPEQATILLRQSARGNLDQADTALLNDIVARLGYHPLSIAITSGLLQRIRPETLLTELAAVPKTEEVSRERISASFVEIFTRSLETLNPQARRCLFSLGVSEKKEEFSFTFIESLWKKIDGSITQQSTLDLVDSLEVRSLITVEQKADVPYIRLHPFLRELLRSLPAEVLPQMNDPQTFRDFLGKRRQPLNEVKVVFVGEGSVGKTSLVNRLIHNTYDPNSEKTGGIAIHRWAVANLRKDELAEWQRENSATTTQNQKSEIKVNIWDFGGQEIMHATHQFFLTRRTLYVLVFDTRYNETENRLDYWLTIIRSFAGDSPILLVGNKTDQHPLDLESRSLLAKHPTIQVVLETSCATGIGIVELHQAIEQQLAKMSHIADPLPETWFAVKSELEQINTDFIPHQRYIELCRERKVNNPESQQLLLGFLHDLGIVLHFPEPHLETTNILNPEWVTQGVYRILNADLLIKKLGILTWDMLTSILSDDVYQDKRAFIIEMMLKFELCYELPDSPHTYLIPNLLPREAADTGRWNDVLCFEIQYPALPSSIFIRLVVRMHRHIKAVGGIRIVWRTGVLFTCEGNEALVKVDITANCLTIAVRGPDVSRRDMLTRIREHLEAIHSGFPGLQAAEMVPVPGHPEIPPVDYRWLRECERRGQPTEITPTGLYESISVRQLLDGVETLETRRERESRGGDTYYQFYHSQVGVAGDNADVDDGIHLGRQAVSESPNLSE